MPIKQLGVIHEACGTDLWYVNDGKRTYRTCKKCLARTGAARGKAALEARRAIGRDPKPISACPKCGSTNWVSKKRAWKWHCGTCRAAKCIAARRINVAARAAAATKRKASSELRRVSETKALDSAEDARRERLPKWKQPLWRGDEQDIAIWKVFTVERLRMEKLSRGDRWPIEQQGRDLMQRAGMLRAVTDGNRLFDVLASFGSMLVSGEPLGDTSTKPWEC